MQHRARLALPQPVAEFSRMLEGQIPHAELEIDRPRSPDGEWWLDVVAADFRSSVAWRSGQGFGVFTRDPEFADRPDEIYRDPAIAAKRLGQIHAHWKTSASSVPLWLNELRQLRGTAQTALAETLSQSQAAISQLERREDIRLSTLRRYVMAMGGRLEMRVVFDDFSAAVDIAASDKTGQK